MLHNPGITADTAKVRALAVDAPQPVWMTLDTARERAFTGEIVFETDPEVFAYLDNGVVYYAERASDLSLGRRLLRAGVVDGAQLECGTVRVGEIEHLGRLFDRDPSIDRDAVIVLAEITTQELISELANESIAPARFTAYRHHPSGVHRWFVAPSDPVVMARAVGAVAQPDATMLGDPPALSFDDADVDDLVIEWDEEIDDIPERQPDVFELSSALIEFTDADGDDDSGDHAPGVEPVEAAVVAHGEPVDALDVSDAREAAPDSFEFSVVWPDGFEEPTTEATRYRVESSFSLDESSDVEADDELVAEIEAVLATSDDGSFRFSMPLLVHSGEPDNADAAVPDDVAEAVRRAIAAIESASFTAPGAGSAHGSSVLRDVEILADPAIAEIADQEPTSRAPAGRNGFAPPTMATHAEVLFAQMAAENSMVDAAPGPDAAGDGSDGGNARSSALRRLIGSLRRKDN